MIRKIKKTDESIYKTLAGEFYHSPAVLHPIPDGYIDRAFEELTSSDRYLEGYLIECEGKPAGYALLTKSFSQEAGGSVVWLDEIYIREAFRGKGLGKSFLEFLIGRYGKSAARLRLEVEEENTRAAALYASYGFKPLAYRQMYVEFDLTEEEN